MWDIRKGVVGCSHTHRNTPPWRFIYHGDPIELPHNKPFFCWQTIIHVRTLETRAHFSYYASRKMWKIKWKSCAFPPGCVHICTYRQCIAYTCKTLNNKHQQWRRKSHLSDFSFGIYISHAFSWCFNPRRSLNVHIIHICTTYRY